MWITVEYEGYTCTVIIRDVDYYDNAVALTVNNSNKVILLVGHDNGIG